MKNPIHNKITKIFGTAPMKLPNQQFFESNWKDQLLTGGNMTEVSFQYDHREDLLKELADQKKRNMQLSQRIRTHEMIQQYYLKELSYRNNKQKNLEWRLSLLSEEINTNSRISHIRQSETYSKSLPYSTRQYQSEPK